MNDTIYALASGHGTAGVAVIRVSGPRANYVLLKISSEPIPKPRLASLRRLRDIETGRDIDDALVIWFPGPASFTGEDIVEFHAHGGTAVISKADIQAKQAELKTAYDNAKYQRDRKAEYPSIEDQLDDLYHNGIDGWKATIKVTKDKYPKG